ncbi:MAG TPA: FAD-dependent oxidoreductase, partial [Planctomycetaceae bacterium]|nr:FAD-dependent oxidoreductase [Planctomycetaceae bacterium]
MTRFSFSSIQACIACMLTIIFLSTTGSLTQTVIAAEILEADVVIYGGTSAGVAAAVQCKRMGKTTLIIEPSAHLGGLTAGGLGWTDSGNKSVIGGISEEFYERVKNEYDLKETWKWQESDQYSRYNPEAKVIWVFEPHIAEKVFNDLITEYEIPVYMNERLELNDGVTTKAGQIVEFKLESGKIIRGKRFIDATYEGDLMAKAG